MMDHDDPPPVWAQLRESKPHRHIWRRISVIHYIGLGVFVTIVVLAIVKHNQPAHNSLGVAQQLSAHTYNECLADFDDLYLPIDRSVHYWTRRNHSISTEDIARGPGQYQLRVLVHDNEVRVIHGHPEERARSILLMMHQVVQRATALGERLPSMEVVVSTSDINGIRDDLDGPDTVWAFATENRLRQHDRAWLIPDFNLYASDYQSYQNELSQAQQHDRPVAEKKPRAFWRGVPNTNLKLRNRLLEVTENKSWAAVSPIDWSTMEFMPPDMECDYAFVISAEGTTQSSHLTHALQCDSVPIVHDLAYSTTMTHLLQPNGTAQNYVKVNRDWSDLEAKVTWLLDNPAEAQRIADNSVATFRNRNLSPAAVECYLKRLIHAYASVSEAPRIYRPPSKMGGRVLRKRGIPASVFLTRDRPYVYDEAEK